MMNSAPVPEGELVSKILLKMEGKMNRLQFTLNSESRLLLQADWEGSSCDLSLHNPTGEPVTAGEITVYSGRMMFQSDTPCYGEGYRKLAQYKGTVGDFTMFGKHGDHEHYRLPVKEGWNQCYNMLLFTPAVGEALLLGFASCHRFGGIFRFNKEQLHILLNCEDIVLQPGETIALEQFFMESGDKNKVLEAFGEAICRNHPMLEIKEIPTGWCSWLVYGPNITEQNICANMMAIKERGLALKYIQIDDGYQPHMGDWLSVTDKFNGGIRKICAVIKKAGFEPAIWVAPFIAEEGSKLFGEHPDWFVTDGEGKPLASDRVSFGGWRCGPWYMLDGTHPGARAYLTHVFRVMKEEWGIHYFKLDANMWGALPFGRHHEKNRTCIEAYRMGMEAILEGAGRDSFLLGCNAPMWPSLGLVHGMRVTNDNSRSYERFYSLAQECFHRNWQHNRLWINDPDAFVLENHEKEMVDPAGRRSLVKGKVTEDEFLLCAAYVLASGGMALSGDDITKQTRENDIRTSKLLPPTGVAAQFEDEECEVGKAVLSEGRELLFFFNYGEEEKDYMFPVKEEYQISDYWTEERLEACGGRLVLKKVRPHSARVLELVCPNKQEPFKC